MVRSVRGQCAPINLWGLEALIVLLRILILLGMIPSATTPTSKTTPASAPSFASIWGCALAALTWHVLTLRLVQHLYPVYSGLRTRRLHSANTRVTQAASSRLSL